MNSSSSDLVEPLTRREQAILLHLVEDKSNHEIAVLETLSLNSVKWYIQQIYTKLGVNRRAEVAGRVHELGLLQPTPTPTSASSRPKNNLPAQLTSFIGREQEISELRLKLKKKGTRLLTLTGSGGTGKTRLALQVAAGLLDAFPDGVWLVELAPLADPGLVPQTVIAALGLVEPPGKTPTAFLADYLQSRHLLLILDNCEHLVGACAALSAHLLHSAPHLTILASSREILGVEGEIPFRVPPLGMPDPHHLPSLEDLARFEAVRLFVERAGVVSPGFALTTENASVVGQITQRLDGIPLAIELAAARLRLLSVEQIALRLNDSFRLLTGGARTALPRHQTLQALIDWSYNLLSEAERALLRSLSVFAGGWTLEAAEEACSTENTAGQDILDLLGQLADKSLILVVQTAGGEMRYRMLETIRQYAHTRLVETGEAAVVRQRHLAYYLHMAEILEPKLRGREQIHLLDYLLGELDNLRIALEWGLQSDIDAELRLSASLLWFWGMRSLRLEGVAWLEQGLAAEALNRVDLSPAASQTLVRAKALSVLGGLLTTGLHSSVPINANPRLTEALAIYQAIGSEQSRGLVWTLIWMSYWKQQNGDPLQARVLAEEAMNILHESGDTQGKAECLFLLGILEIDPARQKIIHQEQLAIHEANGDMHGIATALMNIGYSHFVNGDYETSITAFEVSREHSRQVGDPEYISNITIMLAKASCLLGDLEHAALHLEEALAVSRDFANDQLVAECLFWKTMLAFAQGRNDQVVDLIEEVGCIALKTGDQGISTNVLYHCARLARLRGDTASAQKYAEEGMKTGHDLGKEKMHLLLELGYLALHEGDLVQAGALWRESLQIIINRRRMEDLNMILDGLAVLAVRQGKMERAARLFGTRLWRGWAHALSPIERAEREVDFAAITAALGEERFAQLRDEGLAMPFMQVLALAQQEC